MLRVEHRVGVEGGLDIAEGLVHLRSKLVVEDRHCVSSVVGGKSDLNHGASFFTLPLGMVIILIAEVADFLDKCLTSFESVEFECLDQGILNVREPFNTTLILNGVDFVCGHLDQLRPAEFIESLVFLLDSRQLRLVQSKSMLELHRKFLIWLNWDKKARL